MQEITANTLRKLFKLFGEGIATPTTFYLMGGSALCLLGSQRATLDVDYSFENAVPEAISRFEQLAEELKLDLEYVAIEEFIPLPPGAEQRHRFIGRFGHVDVYIFDPYSIALSKVARGFEADLEDVEFLLNNKFIAWETLKTHFEHILPEAQRYDIDSKEFINYFKTLQRKMKK